jgi:drug/metabolite transporter (DMT)-like permease
VIRGYGAAALAVLIWASYPVVTRAGVTGAFVPDDLMLLRFGVGALLFLPFILCRFHAIGRQVWLRGVPLALFQGAGMAALVICGLQFAPANHAAALGPGVVSAWVAVLGFLLFARRPSPSIVTGASLCALGVLAYAWSGVKDFGLAVLAGDAMFLAASALGALYLLQLRRWEIGATEGAAIVALYSAAVIVPWYLWSPSAGLWQAAPLELLWQVLWQGVLIGCVSLVALSKAVEHLGAERAGALVAFVPALSSVLGLLFLNEVPSSAEIAAILAITAGVSLGAYAGSPAARSAAAKRSACGLSRPG